MERMSFNVEQRIITVLENHHKATASRNIELLKDCFVSWAQFVGTDDSEQWSLEEYVSCLEGTESGWDMTECLSRFIHMVGTVKIPSAMFFEVVRHAKYGLMRGSGVVIKDETEWKIVQYVLSFSVPNHVVDKTNLLELLTSPKQPQSSEIDAMCEV